MEREAALQALSMQKHTVDIQVGEQTITLETGYMAKQAAGSITVRCGDTMVLSTVCDATLVQVSTSSHSWWITVRRPTPPVASPATSSSVRLVRPSTKP